jgi:hypothetical protein
MSKAVIATLTVSLVCAGCGGGGSSGSDTSTSSTAATTVTETTAASTTTAETTTTVAEPEALVEVWVSADDFLSSVEEASAAIAEQNSSATALELDVNYEFGITAEAPDAGTFVWVINDGIYVGGLDALDAEGDAGTGRVLATTLFAKQSNDLLSSAVAPYLAVYGDVSASTEVGAILQSDDPAAEATVVIGDLTLHAHKVGADPANDPIIAITVYPTAEPELAALAETSVTTMFAAS